MLVYALTSPTGRVYIGQTIQPLPKRWYDHRRAARSGRKSKLYTSMRKHTEGWTQEVVYEASSQEELDRMEIMFIRAFGDLNIREGGRGGKLTSEHRAKIAAAHRGRKRSDEARKAMSEAAKKKVFTDEHRRNMSKAQLRRQERERTR